MYLGRHKANSVVKLGVAYVGRSGRSRGNTHVGDVHTRMNLKNGEVNDAAEQSCYGGKMNMHNTAKGARARMAGGSGVKRRAHSIGTHCSELNFFALRRTWQVGHRVRLET